ncbi:hypothetical protein ACLB1G_22240 [Oxalobacteraceae bacterium A2-2]
MDDKRQDVESGVMKMYRESSPDEKRLFDVSNVNHLAWSLVLILLAVVFWLVLALQNAENQRYALLTKQCADPMFKGEIDQACLLKVEAREHWWDNVWYAITHIKPERG